MPTLLRSTAQPTNDRSHQQQGVQQQHSQPNYWEAPPGYVQNDIYQLNNLTDSHTVYQTLGSNAAQFREGW